MTESTEAPHALVPRRTGIVTPALSDGAGMWEVAAASGELDLNSSYMYLLYARDFAQTCRVALVDDVVVGFVLGYRRDADPRCLFVWQIAVDEKHRGEGLAGRLLDDLVTGAVSGPEPVTHLETTITEDNTASRRLFARFAERWEAPLHTTALFDAAHFPDDHEPERLHRIGPLGARPRV